MAKGAGKLTKIKSVLKKMQSFKLGRPDTSSIAAANNSSDNSFDPTSKDLHPVYVGKSRRRYMITSDVMENPLFRELVQRIPVGGDEKSITVGCEVVLFEHLLWMLENADPPPESLDELVDFYAC
ncbi:auxin-responsive protein SAUR76-like [Primulina eburnea]|uniref:auxin-responsive protein SAUR76-like n=1 Tax=Primulina eburnea TaxID=1245227 RepID=UPI003C6C0A19